jgi:hypothetical protein
LSNFSSDKALGALSEGMNDQIDFDAPPERMVLEGQNRSLVKGTTFKDSTYPPIPILPSFHRYLKKLAGSVHVYHPPDNPLRLQKF